jgi:hypothetical protein
MTEFLARSGSVWTNTLLAIALAIGLVLAVVPGRLAATSWYRSRAAS